MNFKIKFFLSIWVFAIFLMFIGYAQQPSNKRDSSFNKHCIGKIIPDTKTMAIPIQTEPDSLCSKRTIKPGYVIGLAVTGFLAGLFFGAETAHGEISGAAFHIKPAIIGATIGTGLGVAVSLLEPGKVREKRE